MSPTLTELPRILIVDDEPFNVDLLEQELHDLGYATDSAGNGQEALQKVGVRVPDLILLDVLMPVMDGFTTCRILKEDNETRLIPIIIMTSLGATEDRIRGIEAGADDFLTRPIDKRELQARIATALKLRQTMVEKIREIVQVRDHFAKFVPDAVKRLVADNPDAPELAKREEDVSVLFVDICGYTSLSEGLSPHDLNSLVERYFSAYLDCIHESGGDLSQTAGDGLMAIFLDPDDPVRHATTAVKTARALFSATEMLNKESCGPPIALHMGLNSGVAAVGSTCFEGLRGTRWIFTAYGVIPNIAARLADIAEAGQILVGPETAGRIQHQYPLEKVGRKRLKNVADPVDIYRLSVRADTI